MIEVYTDGACSGNPGPGGWAWVTPDGALGSGAEAHTTNQRMEVQAVLEAIRSNPEPIHIFSDSTYVVNCFKDKWYEGWKKRGWKNSQRKPVANRDLWEPLIDEAVPRISDGSLKFSWVKGHSGNPMNDRADELAVAAKDALLSVDGAGPAPKPRVIETDLPDIPEPAEGDAVPWPVGPALLVVGATTPSDSQVAAVREAVRSLGADAVLVSGLRRGTELIAAEEAVKSRIPLAVVLPFADPAVNWDDSARSRFDEVFARASFEVVLDGDPTSPGNAVKQRNRWFEQAALGVLVVDDEVLANQYSTAGLTVVTI